ncbi:MAG: hypothetical protein KBE16_03285 [Alphaproteobacteria bacterium]|jgi:hypothetical protein|nr:hypothetical protein [Alphaproteobacteria bacterium]MBP9877070.1 hypothetical protein [Alphaproteobacteria bacterium]
MNTQPFSLHSVRLTPLAKKLSGPTGNQENRALMDDLYLWKGKTQAHLQGKLSSKEYAKYARFLDAIDASIQFLIASNEQKI